MVNYELLSYSALYITIISKHPTMQDPRRMPWSYPAVNTVSTKRNLLNSLLYFVLARDVEAAYSRCRPSTSHDMTSVAGRASKDQIVSEFY